MTTEQIERITNGFRWECAGYEARRKYESAEVRSYVNSVMCYGGSFIHPSEMFSMLDLFSGDHRILTRREVVRIAKSQERYFNKHAEVVCNVSTDSEGCSYNGIRWHHECIKKNAYVPRSKNGVAYFLVTPLWKDGHRLILKAPLRSIYKRYANGVLRDFSVIPLGDEKPGELFLCGDKIASVRHLDYWLKNV